MKRGVRTRACRAALCVLAAAVWLSACGQTGGNANGSAAGPANGAEAGSQAEVDWQSQYDLGIRLLEEGKYEEAILAFTAAIEIEPKKAALYIARGEAHAARAGENGSTDGREESLENAASDYDQAVTLLNEWYGGDAWQEFESGAQAGMLPEDMSYEEAVKRAVEAYRQLAEGYAAAGDYEAAAETVKKASDLLDGCVRTEGDGGVGETAGISEELLEQLKNQLSEQLKSYEEQAAGGTPEGTLNAYSVTAFEERERYRAYDTLSGEEQAWVERMVRIARSGNVEALEEELPDSEPESGMEVFYTSRESWRLCVEWSYSETPVSEMFVELPGFEDTGAANPDRWVRVELREENGAAYACECIRTEGVLGYGGSDDSGWAYYTGVTDTRIWASGGCAGWQWEGPVSVSGAEGTTLYEEGAFHSHDEFRWTESGAMSGGLREGSFTYDWTYAYTSPNYEDTAEESQTTVYHGGIGDRDGAELFYTVTGLGQEANYEAMFWLESIFW